MPVGAFTACTGGASVVTVVVAVVVAGAAASTSGTSADGKTDWISSVLIVLLGSSAGASAATRA